MLDQLDAIDFSLLKTSKRGIERETLRTTQNGYVAQTVHPATLGEKQTNELITVDFSEGLLEYITPPFDTYSQTYDFLRSVSAYTKQNMQSDELMWSASMPPPVEPSEIQIAEFGHNPSGQMKEVYRKGLALRYGKVMQAISGIHYNYSISEAFLNQLSVDHLSANKRTKKNQLYFRMIKRFYQISWLLPYLFGSSPICPKSLAESQTPYIETFDNEHFYGPYATCLRMSDLGYQSEAQKQLFISYRNVEEYVRDLLKATDTRYPEYIRKGMKDDNGHYQQLNDCILQIENEYYNTIRPKQTAKMGERPACALLNRGVEYIEIRVLDVDPFSDVGITEETGHFLEVFVLTCMLATGLDYSEKLILEAQDNFNKVVKYGRQPGLMLTRNDQPRSFENWAYTILQRCMEVASHMDADLKTDQLYQNAVQKQIAKVKDPSLTPSQRMLDEFRNTNQSYHEWMRDLSRQYSDRLQQTSVPDSLKSRFDEAVNQSKKQWQEIEQADLGSFEEYIAGYFNSVCSYWSQDLM
jgi:glutamate--cysteine ligase